MDISEKEEYSLSEFCSLLSISTATGRNWIRLGKIHPTKEYGKIPYFSAAYTKEFLEKLKDTDMLKSRRNKTYISGSGFYRNYISPDSPNLDSVEKLLKHLAGFYLTDCQIRILLAECALQLLCQAGRYQTEFAEHFLFHYLNGELQTGPYDVLLWDLLAGTGRKSEDFIRTQFFQMQQEMPGIFSITYLLEKNVDILGLLYLSLKNLGERKAAGSYYTPTRIVKKLIEPLVSDHPLMQNFKILDPCCGTGNFLLQLPEYCSMKQIFGGDIDETSILIARINMALKFQSADVSEIREQIQVRDFLLEQDEQHYDLILGNPPWGFQFHKSAETFLKKNFQSAGNIRTESCDVFLEQAFAQVNIGGTIAFVIPEAVLHVRSHLQIRRLILERAQIERLEYLGNVFHKVQCPAVILQITKTDRPLDTQGMKVSSPNRTFVIQKSRSVDVENFNFRMTDEEYRFIEKIKQQPGMTFLKDQAEFALGIVTGNNKEMIQHQKTPGSEVVLKGSSIHKYRITPQELYLTYEPEKFQQTAPATCYRAKEKLLYRFIGSQLIFAYDNMQRLSLNSCNILIPHISHMDTKYILAVLNSRIAQFIYQKKFSSMKVLRTCLEQLPIPCIPEREQQPVIFFAEKLMEITDSNEWMKYYNEIDRRIASAYGVTEQEYQIIVALL